MTRASSIWRNASRFAIPTEKALAAFADHGNVSGVLAADGGDAEEVLARFAKAGIDVDAVAKQLQSDGAKSFVKSWNELLHRIAEKSEALKSAGRATG